MRERPDRLDRLPQQYFTALLARVAAAAAADGEPLVDLGRGNPDVPPPTVAVTEVPAKLNVNACVPAVRYVPVRRSTAPPLITLVPPPLTELLALETTLIGMVQVTQVWGWKG